MGHAGDHTKSQACGKKTARIRKASAKSQASPDIDEDDIGNNQESEASGDDDEFKMNGKDSDTNEEAEDEESDAEMEDDELLNDVSFKLSILKCTIGYSPR